jgi:GNAT superfamily N-acetyltransferase
MVAVEPAAQRSGIGAPLTEHAAAWLRAQGMRVVVIGTGGTPATRPPRALYESLGYRPFPVVQYYRAF